MNNQFSPEELRNILALIAQAQIKGQDAMVVAMLQQKITGLLKSSEVPEPNAEETEDKN